MNYVAAYLTTAQPNQDGDYYQTVFVPDFVQCSLPITKETVPTELVGKDGAKGEKGDPGKSNINLVKVKDV